MPLTFDPVDYTAKKVCYRALDIPRFSLVIEKCLSRLFENKIVFVTI